MMSGQIKRGSARTPLFIPSPIRCKDQAKVILIYHCINHSKNLCFQFLVSYKKKSEYQLENRHVLYPMYENKNRRYHLRTRRKMIFEGRDELAHVVGKAVKAVKSEAM